MGNGSQDDHSYYFGQWDRREPHRSRHLWTGAVTDVCSPWAAHNLTAADSRSVLNKNSGNTDDPQDFPNWGNIKNCFLFLKSNLKMRHLRKGVQANELHFLKNCKILFYSFLFLVFPLPLTVCFHFIFYVFAILWKYCETEFIQLFRALGLLT